MLIQVRNYLDMSNPDTDRATKDSIADFGKKRRDVIYDLSNDKPDEFKQEMLDAIKPIESYLKPKLNHDND